MDLKSTFINDVFSKLGFIVDSNYKVIFPEAHLLEVEVSQKMFIKPKVSIETPVYSKGPLHVFNYSYYMPTFAGFGLSYSVYTILDIDYHTDLPKLSLETPSISGGLLNLGYVNLPKPYYKYFILRANNLDIGNYISIENLEDLYKVSSKFYQNHGFSFEGKRIRVFCYFGANNLKDLKAMDVFARIAIDLADRISSAKLR